MLGLLVRKNPIHDLSIKLGSNLIITHLRFINKSSISRIPKEPIHQNHSSSSFTISYLINSCGLSPHSALSASKKFTINTTENPDSVLTLFKSYDIADTQIAKIIARYPNLLSYDANNTIRPKLEFFLGVGYSNTQLTQLISSSPDFLRASLEKRIIQNFASLRPVFETDNQLLVAVRRDSRLLSNNLDSKFLPNVRLLQGYGIPAPRIAKLATLGSRHLMQMTEQFKMSIESTIKMGFDPSSPMFVHTLNAVLRLSDSDWKRKAALYKSLGWSEEEVVSAFTKFPNCMLVSEKKIRRSMDFFVKEMRWRPSLVAAHPTFLGMSLEKRVIPRCSVLNVLVSKGFKIKSSFVTVLKISEKDFLNKFVTKYRDRVPEVPEASKGNLVFVGSQGALASIHGP